MSDRKRIQIALATSSTLSSQRSAVAPCRSDHPAEPSIPHFAPQVPAEDTELQPSMLVSALTYPPLPTTSRPTYQAKHIAHTPRSGLVENIFSSPARLVYVSALLRLLSARRQAKNALH